MLAGSKFHNVFQEHAKDVVRERGLPKITVDDLVKEITPKGRRKLIIVLLSVSVVLYPPAASCNVLSRKGKKTQAGLLFEGNNQERLDDCSHNNLGNN